MRFGAYICDACQIIHPVHSADIPRFWPWWLAHHDHGLTRCSENERDAMESALELASQGLQVYETTDLSGLVDWMPATADATVRCIM